MAEILLRTQPPAFPLRTITLESDLLKVQVLPELGARIWQITYKPTNSDLLWNNPQIAPARQEIGTSYDDVWSGGWDELFPNDEAAEISGKSAPDHGELWTGNFEVAAAGAMSLHLRFRTPVSSVLVEKKITLSADASRVQFRHRFTNLGATPFPFLWKLHPAFQVSPAHRIDFPDMQVDLEPKYLGTLNAAEQHFEWPRTRIGNRKVDLRRVTPPEEQQLYFFYGHDFHDGWCALTNTETRLACALQFDPQVFSSCWLFASYGGWNDYNVAVLEPCTGYPLHFADMVKANRHRTLQPNQPFETELSFLVQEGVQSVGGINAGGTMFEAAGN
jgi:galactose mutarotase-like enzyme